MATIFVVVDLFRGGDRLDYDIVFAAVHFTFGLLGVYALWHLLLTRICNWHFSPGEARIVLLFLSGGIFVAVSLVATLQGTGRGRVLFSTLFLLPIAVVVRNLPFIVSRARGTSPRIPPA